MCTRNTTEKGVFTPEKMITQAKSLELTVVERFNTGNMQDLNQRGGGLA